MNLVLAFAGGSTLLHSVKTAFSVLKPVGKVSGLMSNDRKVKSLKARWISKTTVNRENDVDRGNIDRGGV